MSYPIEKWWVQLHADEALNDSDKVFTVPSDVEWWVQWIWVELTSTGDQGDRQLVIEIQDSANDVIAQVARAGAVQAASLTRYYMFAPDLADLTAFRDTDYLTTPLPVTLRLQAGDQIRIYDNAAIAAVADDMIVQMQVKARVIV